MANAELKKVIEAAHRACPCMGSVYKSLTYHIHEHKSCALCGPTHTAIDAALRAVATEQRKMCADVMSGTDERKCIASLPLVVDEEEKP